MCPGKFKHRYNQTRVFRDGIFTRNAVQSVLSGISSKDFQKYYSLKTPKFNSHYGEVQCSHASIFIAGNILMNLVLQVLIPISLAIGRYQKFSRTLCQTPWFIEGEKHMDTSIQELICKHLEPFFKTKSMCIDKLLLNQS